MDDFIWSYSSDFFSLFCQIEIEIAQYVNWFGLFPMKFDAFLTAYLNQLKNEQWTVTFFFSLDPSSGRKLFPFPEVLHFFSIPFALN